MAFVVEQDAAAHCEGESEGVVGDLGGAVVWDVAYCYALGGEGDTVETVVTDAHADDAWEELNHNL